MKPTFLFVVAGVLAGWGWLGGWQPCSPKALQPHLAEEPLVPPIDVATAGDPFAHDLAALFEPHGEQVCKSGCAVSRHPTESLSSRRYSELLAAYARSPASEASQALDSLLFYGRQTRLWAHRKGWGPLSAAHVKYLQQELSHTHVRVTIRVVDEQGVIRSQLAPTRVPLDRRHIFDMQSHDLPALITSGTVKRTGLHHLWTRL